MAYSMKYKIDPNLYIQDNYKYTSILDSSVESVPAIQ